MDTETAFQQEFSREFSRIYAETYPMAAALVTAGCRRSADIGDVLQEVYLEVCRILQKRGAGYIREPQALVRRLVKQKLARYYRRHPWIREVYEEPDEDGSVPETADITALSVEETAADREVLRWTDRYLSEKGEITRKIFHLYYRFGLTLPEIADLLGRSEADVRNRLYRTLSEIRAHWTPEKKPSSGRDRTVRKGGNTE